MKPLLPYLLLIPASAALYYLLKPVLRQNDDEAARVDALERMAHKAEGEDDLRAALAACEDLLNRVMLPQHEARVLAVKGEVEKKLNCK
ncbi:hypothetical protein [Larkinella soli]|uniref:hypothetical protein n=1 Tax=Larkinella soli TaxID=1770527 RepID=UPI000FFBD66D|nr:hypothetical protein [Larkinella soli]